MTCDDEKEESLRPDFYAARLLKTRTILINGPVEEELAERVIAQALVLDAESHEPIRVFITTPGGEIDVGFAMHDVLRYIESEVVCIGAGFVASMGVPIMLAARKKNRYSLPNTRYMLHQPMSGAAGQTSDIRITAREIVKLRERLNRLIAEESGTPLDKVTADSDRDFWMTAEEALAYGLVSKIIHEARELA